MNTIRLNGLRGRAAVGLLALAALFNACTSPNEAVRPDTPAGRNSRIPAEELMFFVLTDGNSLNKKSLANPATDVDVNMVTGLQDGEKLLGIDFRPATGQLYGLGSTSRIYVINPEDGKARAIGTGPFSPSLNSEAVGFDFNPAADLIRVVTAAGQNLRINPNTGMVVGNTADPDINGGSSPAVSAVAYTNSRAGVTTTTLYDVDPASDRLFIQNPPNNGTLVQVGPLGKDIAATAGFDISPDNAHALLAFTADGKAELGHLDLNTGKLHSIGSLGTGAVIGLAIPTEPVAFAVSGNTLLVFNPMNISPVAKTITGLQDGETIRGIDLRPATGQLYGLGTSSRIYTINTATGAATAVGGPFTPALSGSDFGFDFNPMADLIRIISNTGQNLAVSPVTGAVTAAQTPINFGRPGDGPVVRAAAYSNNFAGTTSTVLYDLDDLSDKLYRQIPPASGTLVGGSPLGINFEATNGFDIGGMSNKAYALLTSAGSTKLYEVDLNNGMLTPVGNFPTTVRGFALGLGF
ncbi:DUF4394 domain-containing protein [Larkinella soli]|uniref:DUF4394 domain-containing protein n=1 Tax=Larkinella soli TaxID=1770527 RepID=UPI000FFB62DE|nr:DUF4394 domain-containing protein [Larkinella soli]